MPKLVKVAETKEVAPGTGKVVEAEGGSLALFNVAGTAAQLAASATKAEIAKLLKDASALCQELNTRWLEITERVFAVQGRLQTQLSEAAGKWSGTPSP